MNRIKTILLVLLLLASCSKSNELSGGGEEPIDNFAKGADISWATKMASEGLVLYNGAGQQMEATALMKQLGMNSVRFRVWVNPVDGWNSKEDLLIKAKIAQSLGMRIMVDFHYSDTWADPGHQTPPAAWSDYTLSELKVAVADHTTDVLQALKSSGVEVEWVQVGNETPTGMLWPLGKLDYANSNFADLINSGYDAVKGVYPDASVIVHIDQGDNFGRIEYLYDYLTQWGARYDMVGLSLYPDPSTWRSQAEQMIANINRIATDFNRPTMICEVGMLYSEVQNSFSFLKYIIEEGRDHTSGKCHGVFYWEPQAPAGYNGGYDKGAFEDGRPTAALSAFM